ncbi:MAG: hypothetical protein KF723_09245 [Rhizobiaceae bacterium]|nr:hypothetical protein [Rhizobiaceae bacterium]
MAGSVRAVTLEKIVAGEDTAAALGSGDLPVLATPRLLAWCEEATCAALDLADTATSVGARVQLDHLAPSAVGERIAVTATVTERTDRRAVFDVVARNASGREIGRGSVTRAIVDRATFLERLAAR